MPQRSRCRMVARRVLPRAMAAAVSIASKSACVAVAAALAATVGATPVPAQATANVPLHSASYARLDRLVQLGLVDTVIVGHRPYTRREMARMLGEAQRNLHRLGGARAALAGRLVQAVARDLGDSQPARTLGDPLRTRLVERAFAEWRWTDAPALAVPSGDLGSIDARINPVLGDVGRRSLLPGHAALLGTDHSLRLGTAVVAVAAPRAEWDSRGGRVFAERAYLLGSGGPFVLQVGRDELAFGPGRFGGLGVSSTAPSLDMVKLTNDRLVFVPGLSHLFGQLRGTAFVADLGADQNFPHARYAGWKLTGQVTRRIEFGIEILSQQGGAGAPPASFGDRVLDLLPLVDAFVTERDFEISNKLAGADLRLRLDGGAVYWAFLWDDLDPRRLANMMWEDAGHLAGVQWASLGADGALALTVEAHHTGVRMYRHAQFTSGITQGGRLLGSPVGPNANGAFARLSRDDGGARVVELDAAVEWRSGKRYASTGGYDGEPLRFHEIERLPDETRARVVGRVRGEWAGRWSARGESTGWWSSGGVAAWVVEAGVEGVRNESHESGAGRLSPLLRVGVEHRFP